MQYAPIVSSVGMRQASASPVPSRFALKTNLLYAAALLINAEAEFYFKRRLSLNLDWQYAWWSNRSKHKYYRLAAVSPELRYWFASKENFRGHFSGFYVGTGLYEFMARPTHGIQGEFFIAGGLTYGYMFPLGKRLRMEFSFGSRLYDDRIPTIPLGQRMLCLREDTTIFLFRPDKSKSFLGLATKPV